MDQTHRRVELAHPPRVAPPDVVATEKTVLALVAVQHRLFAHAIVPGGDHAAFAARHDLGRVERERRRMTKTAGGPALEARAVGVRGVLHQRHTVAIAE